MKAVFKSSAACGNVRSQNWEEFTDEQLLLRRRSVRQMLALVTGLMLLVVAMAGFSGLYPLALTSAGMITTLDDYLKKYRGITRELQLRGRR